MRRCTFSVVVVIRTEQRLIALYDEYLLRLSSYPDVVRVFQTIRAVSSQNHLPAFQHCT